MIEGLAETLKSLGAFEPADSARTVLNLMRGYELKRLSRHELDSEGFRRRLLRVISSLVDSE